MENRVSFDSAQFQREVDYICHSFKQALMMSPVDVFIHQVDPISDLEPAVYRKNNVELPSGRKADLIVVRGFVSEDSTIEAIFKLRAENELPQDTSAVEIMKASSGKIQEIKFFVNLK